MNTVFFKPKDGLSVIDPKTRQPVPAEGSEVELTSYWRRRVMQGDGDFVPAPSATPAAKATGKSK